MHISRRKLTNRQNWKLNKSASKSRKKRKFKNSENFKKKPQTGKLNLMH